MTTDLLGALARRRFLGTLWTHTDLLRINSIAFALLTEQLNAQLRAANRYDRLTRPPMAPDSVQ